MYIFVIITVPADDTVQPYDRASAGMVMIKFRLCAQSGFALIFDEGLINFQR